jgi:hypothetical protein
MLSIELEVIADLLREEITNGLDREYTGCIEHWEHVDNEHRSAMLDGVYDKEIQERYANHVPNQTTLNTFRDTDAGIGLTTYESADQLIEELFQKVQRT